MRHRQHEDAFCKRRERLIIQSFHACTRTKDVPPVCPGGEISIMFTNLTKKGPLQCGKVRFRSVRRRSQWLTVCRAQSCEHELGE